VRRDLTWPVCISHIPATRQARREQEQQASWPHSIGALRLTCHDVKPSTTLSERTGTASTRRCWQPACGSISSSSASSAPRSLPHPPPPPSDLTSRLSCRCSRTRPKLLEPSLSSARWPRSCWAQHRLDSTKLGTSLGVQRCLRQCLPAMQVVRSRLTTRLRCVCEWQAGRGARVCVEPVAHSIGQAHRSPPAAALASISERSPDQDG
jgi:hypothetical protein